MIIKNGLIADENGSYQADVRIEGEIIGEIGNLIPYKNEEIIDATDKIVLPGGVDVHTHFDLNLGNDLRSTDDFHTGTIAAACGGTTTIIDHISLIPHGASITNRIETYLQLAGNKAVIDYGFHGVTDHVDPSILDELEPLIEKGITSHKFYMTYDGKLTDSEIFQLMERTSKLGVLLCVHAENDGVITYLREKFVKQGKTAPSWHGKSRPPECEAEAVNRAIWLARMAGDAPLYIVHLSSSLGLECVREARAHGQQNLFVETCPQYLLLDESYYLRNDGLKFIMSPPLREKCNLDVLWNGVGSRDIDVIATDHCPFFYSKEKQRGAANFALTPGGAPGVEARIPLMFAQVSSGKLTLERLVSTCCSIPSRLFGLYPQKGVIAKDCDADIVIIDPNTTTTLTHNMLHENCDYTPYEGWPLRGCPILTISRGEVIVRDGQFIGNAGRGQFLKRGKAIL